LFAKIFDDRDIHRIVTGLKAVESRLLSLPEDKRGKNALETPLLLAVFEALSCEEFITDQKLVRDHLKVPFKLLQTNVRLQVTHFVPGATVFLFESDADHCFWAMHTWTKYRQQLKKADFDFAVRGPLSHALALASNPTIDMSFVQLLWCGLGLVIDKLDSDLITHSLRAVEPDVCRLALEHLKYETAGLRFLMQTIEKLLSKSPKDFWDAMGAIPPTTVIEQIFNNKQYDRFMLSVSKTENYEYSALKDMVSWIPPFLASLHFSQQPAVCRLLTSQLLSRLQDERFPEHSRTECYRVGIGVLIWTLRNCNNEQNFDTIGRVAALETLEITIHYIEKVMAITSLPPDDEKYMILVEPSLMLVKAALGLECNSIRCDQELLESAKQLPHGYSSYSPHIWKAVVSALDHDSVVLAKAALSSISDLVGLEKFTTKDQMTHQKEKSEFNIILGSLTHWVCQILERINYFSPDYLDKLFQSPETANALVSSLFSPDASTYEGAVNLIKSISGESARREAIRHLLDPSFETTLNSFSWTTRRIAHKRTFAWCPRMLTTCTDVVDILCDSQDGLLRIRNLSVTSEIEAVENFWQYQWHALTVIYEMTEHWSRRISASDVMKDFCRDTMQFSDHFFDQYGVFAGAIETRSLAKQETGGQHGSEDAQVTRMKLLKYPSQTMVTMVKWLRLRDEYLASTSQALICKVLDRLSEVKLTLSDSASEFLELIITGKIRTILSEQHKASLSRALEVNLGRPIGTELLSNELNNEHSDTSRSHTPHSPTRARRLKSTKELKSGIIDLDKWAAKAKKIRETGHVADDQFDDSDIADEDLLALSHSVSVYKQHPMSKGLATTSNAVLTSRPRPLKSSTLVPKTDAQKHAAQIAFREKREKEIQAKKKRDAEALAKAKGHMLSNKLDDVGLLGKDHAPKGSGMMVSSGSDTDYADDIDQELFGGSTKIPKVSAAVQEYNASKSQHVQMQGPVKKIRQVRTAKDMRARLAPDLSTLHKTILSWDFFHKGDFPPNTDRDNYTLVTSSFRNPVEYQTTFEPLLILEAWQGFLKAKEEATFKSFEIKIASRLTVDSFIEVSTAMDIADGKALGISEADIILLSKASSPTTDANQPHCLARVFRVARKQKQMEISYRVNSGNDIVSALVPNAVIFGVRILSTTPLEREYGALLGLKYYDLCDEIVRAKASPLLKYSDKQVESIGSIYKLNVAQSKAVKSAVDNDAFTLIQG
jgi:senataxin